MGVNCLVTVYTFALNQVSESSGEVLDEASVLHQEESVPKQRNNLKKIRQGKMHRTEEQEYKYPIGKGY